MDDEGLPLNAKNAKTIAMWKAMGHELEFKAPGFDWDDSGNTVDMFLDPSSFEEPYLVYRIKRT